MKWRFLPQTSVFCRARVVGGLFAEGSAGLVGGRVLGAAGRTPAFAMLANPVEQGAFETDVVTQAFGFNPLVPEDFLTLGKEFLIETRLLHEFVGRLVGV